MVLVRGGIALRVAAVAFMGDRDSADIGVGNGEVGEVKPRHFPGPFISLGG